MSYDLYLNRHSRPRLNLSRLNLSGAGMAKQSALICAMLCLSAWVLPPALHAAELGRLFFTAAERAQLEQAQRSNLTPGRTGSAVIVSGIVQKHGGPRTVWVNGVAQSAANSHGSSPDSATVALPGKAQPIKLKVGEKLKVDQPKQADQSRQNAIPQPEPTQ